MARQVEELLPAGSIENERSGRVGGHGDEPGAAERHVSCKAVDAEHGFELARGGVPQTDRVVGSAHREQATVGAEVGAIEFDALRPENPGIRAGGGVPHAGSAVEAGGDDQRSVRAVGGVDRSGAVAAEHHQLLTTAGVDPGAALRGASCEDGPRIGGDQSRPVGTEGAHSTGNGEDDPGGEQRPMQRLDRLRQHALVCCQGGVGSLYGEEHAELRVHSESLYRFRGQLPRGGDRQVVFGASRLVLRYQCQGNGHGGGDCEHGDEEPEPGP